MGKTCSYPGCTSGLAASNKFTAEHGLKKYKYFSIPKNLLRRQQWQKALKRSKPFAGTEVICEKHFADDDILCQDKLLLHDGSIFIADKQRSRLSLTAIPHPYHQETDKKVTGTLDNINHAVKSNSISSNLVDDANIKPETSAISHLYHQETDKKITATLDNVNHAVESNSISSNFVDDANIKLETSAISHPYHQKTDKKVTATLDNVNHVKSINSISSNFLDDANAKPETSRATDSNLCTVIHDQWNIMEKIANITLPEKWTYMICGNNLIIGIWKPNGFFVKRMVLHSNSELIQVFINNEIVNVPGITAMNSSEAVLKNIKILDPLLLCNGKISGQEYSKQCLGFVDSSKTKLRYGNYWCVNCRTIRRKNHLKQMRQEAMLLRYRKKYQCKQKMLKVERQRRKRMQSKIEKQNSKTMCGMFCYAGKAPSLNQ